MQLIHDHLHAWDQALPMVSLTVERSTLAKRRWRAAAQDGTEFGFDLEFPLADRDVFFVSESSVYFISQLPEPVLEIALSTDAPVAARLGWLIGNLHFPIAIEGSLVHAIDDAAIRQLLEREHIAFSPVNRVFRPLGGGHSHAH